MTLKQKKMFAIKKTISLKSVLWRHDINKIPSYRPVLLPGSVWVWVMFILESVCYVLIYDLLEDFTDCVINWNVVIGWKVTGIWKKNYRLDISDLQGVQSEMWHVY